MISSTAMSAEIIGSSSRNRRLNSASLDTGAFTATAAFTAAAECPAPDEAPDEPASASAASVASGLPSREPKTSCTCRKINRSHAHAHDSRTHDSRTNHSHEHRASNGATTSCTCERGEDGGVNRSTGHTHTPTDQQVTHTYTPTENNTPDTDTNTHDKNNNTPNLQTNTSHKHLTTLEGGASQRENVNKEVYTGRAAVHAPALRFIFSLFREYLTHKHVRIHVIYRVHQAGYVIRILVAAPPEYFSRYQRNRLAVSHRRRELASDGV